MTANPIAQYPQSGGATLPSASGAGQTLVSTGAGNTYVAAGTMSLIQTQTLGSAAASITFSAIPQTYKTLKLFVSGGGVTAAAETQLNFNGDVTPTNYFCNTQGYNFNTTAQPPTGGFSNPGALVGNLNTFAAGGGGAEITVFGYATALQKFYVAHSVGAVFEVSGGLWNSSAAITSIAASLVSGGGNWAAGTTISLYGIS